MRLPRVGLCLVAVGHLLSQVADAPVSVLRSGQHALGADSFPEPGHLLAVDDGTGEQDQETEFPLTQRRANVHQNVALQGNREIPVRSDRYRQLARGHEHGRQPELRRDRRRRPTKAAPCCTAVNEPSG